MPTPIVALVGQAGSGKDAVGAVLARKYGAKTLALADPIKNMVWNLMGQPPAAFLWGASNLRNTELVITESVILKASSNMQGLVGFLPKLNMTPYKSQLFDWFHAEITNKATTTYRRLLQTLGTEWGRANYPHVWIDYTVQKAYKLLEDGAPMVVVTDCRFRNEVLAFGMAGAKTVHIINPDKPVDSTDLHASEQEQASIPSFWFDAEFRNVKDGLAKLDRKVELLYKDVYGTR